MKKISLLFCLFVILTACDSGSPLPGPEGPSIDPDPFVNPRQNIPLTELEKGLVTSGNKFAHHFYAKIRDNKETPNVVVSPLSAGLAFSMLNNGAAGITQDEILKTLGFEGYKAADINAYYGKLLEGASSADKLVTLESANSIWVNECFPLLPEFVTVNQQAYDAEIRNEDFVNPATLDLINGWASEKTHGKVPKVLDELDPDNKLILMNALYFLGDWRDPFDEKYTKKETFTNEQGSTTQVDMMNNTINTVYMGDETSTSVILPYGNEAFYMHLILPNENASLKETVMQMDKILNWETSGMKPISARVALKLPRFAIDFDISLKSIMQELGMQSAFDSFAADFSALSEVPTYVSFAKQNAHITVNEKGTEAAAVTTIGMFETSSGEIPDRREFHVNRPFLFLIREVSTDAVFFMGEVTEL